MSVYRKQVQWTFDVDGCELAIQRSSSNATTIEFSIEDTRKNGQEDCHAFGEIEYDKATKQFSWLDGDDSFDDYADVGADAIIDFLNANPLPEEILI